MTARALALVDQLRELGDADREEILRSCTAEELSALRWCWTEFYARPDERAPGATHGKGQVPPAGKWTWWANIGGRGSGKTETCAQWVAHEALRLGAGAIFHLVGATIDDARATMVEGLSGILQASPPWAGIKWVPSVGGGKLTWRSGARARVFGADKPAKGRGPACNRMWIDDPAAFGPHGKDVIDQLLFGFRNRAPDGSEPRGVISSTPLDSDLLSWIMSASKDQNQRRMVYSFSETDDNRANLSEDHFTQILTEFAGTELEQQERFGRYTAGTGKVFKGIDFNAHPIRVHVVPERFLVVAVWIDPSSSSSTKSCEVGIVAGGLTNDGHVWLLEDASAVLGANEWPDRALDLLERWLPHAASGHLGVETNRGGNQPVQLLCSAEKIRRLKAGKPGVSIYEIKRVFALK
ncbi:MAG TPA: terminase family protein, partial [Polyangiales bacterium]|nr:terminase family protein [Polyangiales bacterium]